ncbi:hypothetical protein KAFR_0F02990 [Kazachstania africana CBS 2517]|uniref:Pyruvate decarboxylase n=1 Tax=Kazachstania africana (strain ATCC 22294 / BCRC 22015 / CBS 2517 / CECT 1963 / NBRC 1671 / NRRL Y-8276) TaxID=1071382 RepID=H2AWZ5_KAZAF|nr:hypothetical protein KAFR_0F02990 [Kazachstania africana CBS 2517]CCF58895.1 hypothetical protein KAFR_0F02990 [Kazachstania africana CBS 2517]
MSYTERNSLSPEITIADYLFHRLKQLHVETIFGLPGEFNMPLLDRLYNIPGLKWAGNANELNATYAADGYARLKGLGCIITTFGVGELSAINGIAGAFAEHVGVLHVVGMPPTSAQTKQLLLHHTLGNGDYRVFHRMANDVSFYSRIINDTDLCSNEVDKCIELAYLKQKPVYLGVPVNQVNLKVNSAKLNKELRFRVLKNNLDMENEAINLILKKIYTCESPAIVVDACVNRQDTVKETEQFIRLTNFPVFVTPMGKGSIDENIPTFGGVFSGSISSPNVREVVDFADFVIVIGSLLTEFSTSAFHFFYKSKNCVLLFDDCVRFKGSIYPDLFLKPLMKNILSRLDPGKISFRPTSDCNNPMIVPKSKPSDDQLLRQEWVWHEFSHWFQEGDIIITELGTSSFGINQIRFPSHTKGISQALWGSSGYSMGSCLGACFATLESQSASTSTRQRVILFIGDGAFQITMQEISTMIRWNLTPYIFLLNNQGYSIDRFLHHRKNTTLYDVQQWNYLSFFKVFGATDYETRKIVTLGDLRQMLGNEDFSRADRIRMAEIMLPSMDVPKAIVDKWLQEKEKDHIIPGEQLDNTIHDDSPASLEPERKKSKRVV